MLVKFKAKFRRQIEDSQAREREREREIAKLVFEVRRRFEEVRGINLMPSMGSDSRDKSELNNTTTADAHQGALKFEANGVSGRRYLLQYGKLRRQD